MNDVRFPQYITKCTVTKFDIFQSDMPALESIVNPFHSGYE